MMAGCDQAAGLRRMFGGQGRSLAVLTCGAGAARWLAAQLRVRAGAGQRLLVLEECSAFGNLADHLGTAPRFDLQQVIEGHVPLAQALVRDDALMLLPVARAARLVGRERVLGRRVVDALRTLQFEADETIVHADTTATSSLLRAAGVCLLVAEARVESITAAYAALKKLKGIADIGSMALTLSGQTTFESRELAANFQALAWRQLGIEVRCVDHLGQALPSSPGGFVERLRDLACGLAASPATSAACA